MCRAIAVAYGQFLNDPAAGPQKFGALTDGMLGMVHMVLSDLLKQVLLYRLQNGLVQNNAIPLRTAKTIVLPAVAICSSCKMNGANSKDLFFAQEPRVTSILPP